MTCKNTYWNLIGVVNIKVQDVRKDFMYSQMSRRYEYLNFPSIIKNKWKFIFWSAHDGVVNNKKCGAKKSSRMKKSWKFVLTNSFPFDMQELILQPVRLQTCWSPRRWLSKKEIASRSEPSQRSETMTAHSKLGKSIKRWLVDWTTGHARWQL